MRKIEKLTESRNWKERLIGVKLAPINRVLQIVKNESDEDVCEAIVNRLEENKELDIVKEAYSELANSDNCEIREFVAENAEFKLVLQMAKNEYDADVCEAIVKRLEKNKDLDIVKESYSELANSNNWKIREFVAENAEFELVLEMAKTELNTFIYEVIIKRLEENKDLDIVNEAYSELANSSSSIIREFVAQNAEFELVLQMAKTELYRDVCKVIIKRLEENKDLDIVNEAYSELANSDHWKIREFVAQNSKFELVLQMAKVESDEDVCEAIVNRLEENKELDIVKESYSELANSRSSIIYEFVVANSALDIVQKMIKEEKLWYDRIVDLMYSNPNYINATSEEKLSLLKNIPSRNLIYAVKYERDEKILLWIYKKIK